MVNENLIPKTETVYELKNEIPSFEEFIKTYENDGNLNYDDLSSGDIGTQKGYGPCSNCSGSNRSLKFKLKIRLENCMGSRKSMTVNSTSSALAESLNIKSGWAHWEDGFLDYFSQWDREKLAKRIKKEVEWHGRGNNVDTSVCNKDSGSARSGDWYEREMNYARGMGASYFTPDNNTRYWN